MDRFLSVRRIFNLIFISSLIFLISIQTGISCFVISTRSRIKTEVQSNNQASSGEFTVKGKIGKLLKSYSKTQDFEGPGELISLKQREGNSSREKDFSLITSGFDIEKRVIMNRLPYFPFSERRASIKGAKKISRLPYYLLC